MNAIRLPARRRNNGLGDNLFSTIVSGIQTTVTTDVKSWIITQYATLKALPQRLTQLQREATAIAPYAALSASLAQTLTTQQLQLQSLVSSYPSLNASVDAAYSAVQGGSSSAVTTVLDIGTTVIAAQNFLGMVNAVDASLKAVVDQLLATGAVTPAQAQQLYQSSTSSADGWGKYVLYGGGILLGLWLLKKVL